MPTATSSPPIVLLIPHGEENTCVDHGLDPDPGGLDPDAGGLDPDAGDPAGTDPDLIISVSSGILSLHVVIVVDVD